MPGRGGNILSDNLDIPCGAQRKDCRNKAKIKRGIAVQSDSDIFDRGRCGHRFSESLSAGGGAGFGDPGCRAVQQGREAFRRGECCFGISAGGQ